MHARTPTSLKRLLAYTVMLATLLALAASAQAAPSDSTAPPPRCTTVTVTIPFNPAAAFDISGRRKVDICVSRSSSIFDVPT